MKLVSVFAILALYMWDRISSNVIEIVDYPNVTLSSCGLNAYYSSIHARVSCFQWHQTIREETESLANIENGRYAKPGEFPYTVLIELRDALLGNEASCTGAIINSYWIITAAHCFDLFPTRIRVYVGITDYPTNMNSAPYIILKNFTVHPLYHRNFSLFDIALIELSKEITIDRSNANSVCLPSYNFRMFRTNMTVFSGWGALSNAQSNEHRLRATQIDLDDVRFDSFWGAFITISGVPKYGKTCSGDSGGPLVQYVNGRAVLIGILKGAKPVIPKDAWCGYVNQTFFTAIAFYLEWIISTITAN